jgi:oxygen-independent coproporphyrinogen III oxidase
MVGCVKSSGIFRKTWYHEGMIRHLYIHIPFCHRRCAYCDFNTYANMEDRIEAYVQALCGELAMIQPDQRPATRDESVATTTLRPTIFFGGGTPTMLTVEQFERILKAANAIVPLDGAEISAEANPGTVLGRDYLRDLRSLGINRISMGVQSLNDATLKVLGRIHTAAEAQQSFNDARAAGFDNLNIDFIFGLPGQTPAQWEADLSELSSWGADHLSLYSLVLEEKTPLYAQVTAGRVSVPDDDATAAMYEAAMSTLAGAGYVQYEISNWARGGTAEATFPRACHHNLAYWHNVDYLAAGAGAHGHVFPQRYYNILGIDDYIRAVRAGERPIAETIALSERDLYAETMFMGLRLNEGVPYARFAARCGSDLEAVYGPVLNELAHKGLIERDAIGVRLTPRGRMLGNQVFAEFV